MSPYSQIHKKCKLCLLHLIVLITTKDKLCFYITINCLFATANETPKIILNGLKITLVHIYNILMQYQANILNLIKMLSSYVDLCAAASPWITAV